MRDERPCAMKQGVVVNAFCCVTQKEVDGCRLLYDAEGWLTKVQTRSMNRAAREMYKGEEG